ncbi:MAG: GNAT family N-acetyltransferase [candidate division Zixibacteria bacterium]|nr:GNAT family N-acetyltransferase [candidate division Zixibacteria bacterium]
MTELFRCGHFVVRPITEHNIESTLKVYQQSEDFLSLGPNPQASIQMVYSDMECSERAKGLFCGIWNISGTHLGILDFVPEIREKTAFVTLLMIARPYRNRGIGADIVTALCQYLVASRAIKTIESTVQINNERGIKFWKKCGFHMSEQAEPQADGTTTFRLRLELPV